MVKPFRKKKKNSMRATLELLPILQNVSRQKNNFKENYFSETIINNLPGIFYLYDESGKFVKWNRNFELVTGYSGHEISQMSPLLLMKMKGKDQHLELVLF
jgi:PAS domain-containing protein